MPRKRSISLICMLNRSTLLMFNTNLICLVQPILPNPYPSSLLTWVSEAQASHMTMWGKIIFSWQKLARSELNIFLSSYAHLWMCMPHFGIYKWIQGGGHAHPEVCIAWEEYIHAIHASTLDCMPGQTCKPSTMVCNHNHNSGHMDCTLQEE